MRSELVALSDGTFDVLVVGGGVYGAAVAHCASIAGRRVALVEQGDFACGASSNSLKILHGGLRYLQQLDFVRMRRSIRARRDWAQLAPSCVTPLPCVTAARGAGLRSPLVFAAALLLNDLIGADRNAGLPEACRLPRGRLVPRREHERLSGDFTAISSRGAMWWDALALAPEQLVIELLRRAAGHRAVLANYVEAVRLSVANGRVHGVGVRDRESGKEIEIRARLVVCAAGPGTGQLLSGIHGPRVPSYPTWCAALNVVLKRDMLAGAALGVTARLPAVARGIGMTGRRDLFFVPWRNRTLLGTHYELAEADAMPHQQRRDAAMRLLELANRAAPRAHLQASDIALVHWGLLPLDRRWTVGAPPRLAAEHQIRDYADAGVAGLWTVAGTKFTTAREVARQLLRRMGVDVSRRPELGHDASSALLVRADNAQLIGLAAARHGQARRLEDAIMRRSSLGTAGYPGYSQLQACARGMAAVLDWDEARIAREIAEVTATYREQHFWDGTQPVAGGATT